MPLTPHPRTEPLLVLASGPFGRAVAAHLDTRPGAVVQNVEHGTHASLWPHAGAIVLATHAERPRIAEAVDATAFIRGIPWLSVILEATEIQAGPLVVPGRTPCHRCFRQRRAQHTRRQLVLDEPPAAEPSGFARHHVALAAALADAALADAGSPKAADDPMLGSVRRFHLVHGTLSRYPVVAVDGCDRCRGRLGPRQHGRQQLWNTLESELDTARTPEVLV